MNRPLWVSALLLLSILSEVRGLDYDVAVYDGSKFQLHTIGSRSPISIPCPLKVGSFSLAPNGRFIAFTSVESRAATGYLYVLNVETQKTQRLLAAPFYFRERGQREEYTDAEISPDSQQIAFSVHSVQGNDADDLVGLAGPLAMVDVASGQVHVVRSTLSISNHGPVFINTPAWSPDGERILIAFEVGGAIVNVKTQKLQLLDSTIFNPSGHGTYIPLSWWSKSDLFFVWNPSAEVSGIGKLFAFNTTTNSVKPGAAALGLPSIPSDDVTGVDVSPKFVLVRYKSTADLFVRSGQRLAHFETDLVRLRSSP
jgi:WD40-like Beta Propeller Repeat